MLALSGDCEKDNDHSTGGGLFKTDIESLAGVIVFSRRWRGHCMRDYMERIHGLHSRSTNASEMEVAATATSNTDTSTSSATAASVIPTNIGMNISENFDKNAATLDVVLTPEAQNIPRKRT